jgi:asparagine synthase (glutamine-hydrolysing)
MCGLCGIVGFGDQLTAERMAQTLVHRGPDGAGSSFFPQEKVSLGFRRLAIIDLSEAGDQPMASDDGQVSVIFNGEIYNFQELRLSLEARGRRFRSRTDTEVLLAQYELEGPECVRRLNGMFAYAILDRRRGKLVLARDRLGIKPLYYHRGPGRFVFGSEIKAILASGAYSPELNRQSLYDYFTYLYVPCPNTIYKDVLQVPPANVLEVDLKTLDVKQWSYWDVSEDSTEGFGGEELRELLTDSVRRQMVSDVPLGVFLSGGVDSPILTGLLAQVSPAPVKSFTVVFQGKGLDFYDEAENARIVAERFRTDHHEIPISITDPSRMLELVEHFDQPFGNPTFYLMQLISRAARSEVTVALCGAGGDELFAGYPRYRAVQLARRLRWAPPWMIDAARGALGLLPDAHRSMTLRRAREFLEGIDPDFARQFMNWTYFFTDGQKRRLLGPLLRSETGRFEPSDRILRQVLAQSRLPDQGNRLLEADIRTFLVDNILEYTDKMSMAASLEVRVPYLDHRVVGRSLAIPFDRKLRGGDAKAVLKETFADLLPQQIRRSPKKGFNAPLPIWMRDNLDPYFDLHMPRSRMDGQGIFDWEYLQQLREEHRRGRRDNSYELFSVLMFDVWHRRYMEGEEAVPDLQVEAIA